MDRDDRRDRPGVEQDQPDRIEEVFAQGKPGAQIARSIAPPRIPSAPRARPSTGDRHWTSFIAGLYHMTIYRQAL